MRVAIVQPYFCPYLGYFQLVNAVDVFVFYDDVQYTKRGYINRNILKDDIGFTVPVRGSSTKRIIDVDVDWENKFFVKFPKTIERLYSRCENYSDVLDIIDAIFEGKPQTISELAIKSVKSFSDYLKIETRFLSSSDLNLRDETNDKTRNLIDICKSVGGDHYINPIGGKALYDPGEFKKHGVKLNFLQTVPSFSIIDICMRENLHDVTRDLRDINLI